MARMEQPGIKSKSFADGEILFYQGEPGQQLFRLKFGAVILFLAVQKVTLLDIVREGRFFGFAALGKGYHLFNAEAVGTCAVDIIDVERNKEPFLTSYYSAIVQDLVRFNKDTLSEKYLTEEETLLSVVQTLPEFKESLLARFFSFALVNSRMKAWKAEGKVIEAKKGVFRYIQ